MTNIEFIDRRTGYPKTPNIFYQTRDTIEPLVVASISNTFFAFYKYDGSCIRLIHSSDDIYIRGRRYKSSLEPRYIRGIRMNYREVLDAIYDKLGGDGWVIVYAEAYGGKYLSSDFYDLNLPSKKKIRFSKVDEHYGDVPGIKAFAIRKITFDDNGVVDKDEWYLGLLAWRIFMSVIDKFPHGLVDIATYAGHMTVDSAVETVSDIARTNIFVVEGLVLWSKETEKPVSGYHHNTYVGRYEDVVKLSRDAHFRLPNFKVKARDIARFWRVRGEEELKNHRWFLLMDEGKLIG